MSIEHDIVTQEERLATATRTLDVEALDRIYADDILMTGVLGETCGKAVLLDEARRGAAQRAQAATAGQPLESAYDKDDLKVVIGHGDAAVTSYRFAVTFKGAGIDIRRRYRTTNVWVKRDGRWQVIASQATKILPQGTAP